jgi:heptosyltransferase I
MQDDFLRQGRRRVLIVRIGAMGDVLHAMPAVAALKERHPECFVGWVIDPKWLPLLQSRSGEMPLVDAVYLARAREWSRKPLLPRTVAEIRSLRGELKSARFDLCVDMQGAIRSAVIGKMAGVPKLVGPVEPREAPARWLYGERVGTGAVHVVDQGCELLGGAVGETLRPARVELPADSPRWEAMARELKEGFVLLAPTAGWGAKQWPAERFGAVAAELGRRGYRVVVNAASAEDEVADAVVRASEGAAFALPCDLAQLIAVTRRAGVVIAGDTGPLHLAAALERPVVGLFGPTNPARNGPYGTRARVLRHGEERRDHRRLAEPEAGLLKITVDEVVEAAVELLEG